MFEYYPETHTYWLDGKQLPGVTEIVSVYGPDFELDEFEDILGPATERGTVMHDYIYRRFHGEEPEDIEIPDIYQDYADGVELFLSEHTFIGAMMEHPLGSAHLGFAGTPDYYGWFDDEPTILDWKFVSQLVKHKVAAQLGGYLQLITEGNQRPVSQLAAVQFLPNTYRLYRCDLTTAARLFYPAWLLSRRSALTFQRGSLILKGDPNGSIDPV